MNKIKLNSNNNVKITKSFVLLLLLLGIIIPINSVSAATVSISAPSSANINTNINIGVSISGFFFLPAGGASGSVERDGTPIKSFTFNSGSFTIIGVPVGSSTGNKVFKVLLGRVGSAQKTITINSPPPATYDITVFNIYGDQEVGTTVSAEVVIHEVTSGSGVTFSNGLVERSSDGGNNWDYVTTFVPTPGNNWFQFTLGSPSGTYDYRVSANIPDPDSLTTSYEILSPPINYPPVIIEVSGTRYPDLNGTVMQKQTWTTVIWKVTDSDPGTYIIEKSDNPDFIGATIVREPSIWPSPNNGPWTNPYAIGGVDEVGFYYYRAIFSDLDGNVAYSDVITLEVLPATSGILNPSFDDGPIEFYEIAEHWIPVFSSSQAWAKCKIDNENGYMIGGPCYSGLGLSDRSIELGSYHPSYPKTGVSQQINFAVNELEQIRYLQSCGGNNLGAECFSDVELKFWDGTSWTIQSPPQEVGEGWVQVVIDQTLIPIEHHNKIIRSLLVLSSTLEETAPQIDDFETIRIPPSPPFTISSFKIFRADMVTEINPTSPALKGEHIVLSYGIYFEFSRFNGICVSATIEGPDPTILSEELPRQYSAVSGNAGLLALIAYKIGDWNDPFWTNEQGMLRAIGTGSYTISPSVEEADSTGACGTSNSPGLYYYEDPNMSITFQVPSLTLETRDIDSITLSFVTKHINVLILDDGTFGDHNFAGTTGEGWMNKVAQRFRDMSLTENGYDFYSVEISYRIVAYDWSNHYTPCYYVILEGQVCDDNFQEINLSNEQYRLNVLTGFNAVTGGTWKIDQYNTMYPENFGFDWLFGLSEAKQNEYDDNLGAACYGISNCSPGGSNRGGNYGWGTYENQLFSFNDYFDNLIVHEFTHFFMVNDYYWSTTYNEITGEFTEPLLEYYDHIMGKEQRWPSEGGQSAGLFWDPNATWDFTLYGAEMLDAILNNWN